jgi:hypothetical protein
MTVNRAPGDARRGERGQILILALLMLFALIGITGLAIDVSNVFMEQRAQRSVADAAALAGAQDMQKPGTKAFPGATEQTSARQRAMRIVRSLLRSTTPLGDAVPAACLTATGCGLPGTPYNISIYAGVTAGLPSPTCLDCEPERAVQVVIRQPSFGLTFSRALGFSTWNVATASVAGVVHARQFAVATLRPPDPRDSATDPNQADIFITGGSKVVIADGDVMTNTNVVCSGAGSELVLDAVTGYAVYHFDAYKAWTSGSGKCLNPPNGVQVTSPVADPGYSIPQRVTGIPVYNNVAQAMGTDAADPNYDPNYATRCAAQQALVPSTYRELKTAAQERINDATKVKAVCVRPGIYNFLLESKTTLEAVLLEPGVYFFDYGLNIADSLIGGYEPDKPGVALVFLEAKNQSGTPGQMTTSSATSLLALNVGSTYCPGTTCPTGKTATPAVGPQGLVQTPAPNSVLITVMVERDPGCIVGPTAPSAAVCKESENHSLKLTGGGSIYLAGVQYAPSDNVELKGNSGQDAEVGALWAWTLKFDSSKFNLRTANPQLFGVLRLDRACSPGQPCSP